MTSKYRSFLNYTNLLPPLYYTGVFSMYDILFNRLLGIFFSPFQFIFKKSRIRETPTLSTDAASRTDTKQNKMFCFFFFFFAPHRTAPHCTALHRTATHRTAPHRTAPQLKWVNVLFLEGPSHVHLLYEHPAGELLCQRFASILKPVNKSAICTNICQQWLNSRTC